MTKRAWSSISIVGVLSVAFLIAYGIVRVDAGHHSHSITIEVDAGEVLIEPIKRDDLLKTCDQTYTLGFPQVDESPTWKNGENWVVENNYYTLKRLQPWKSMTDYIRIKCSEGLNRVLQVNIVVNNRRGVLPDRLVEYPNDYQDDYLYDIPHPTTAARIDVIETLVAVGNLEITATNVAYLATEVAEDNAR